MSFYYSLTIDEGCRYSQTRQDLMRLLCQWLCAITSSEAHHGRQGDCNEYDLTLYNNTTDTMRAKYLIRNGNVSTLHCSADPWTHRPPLLRSRTALLASGLLLEGEGKAPLFIIIFWDLDILILLWRLRNRVLGAFKVTLIRELLKHHSVTYLRLQEPRVHQFSGAQHPLVSGDPLLLGASSMDPSSPWGSWAFASGKCCFFLFYSLFAEAENHLGKEEMRSWRKASLGKYTRQTTSGPPRFPQELALAETSSYSSLTPWWLVPAPWFLWSSSKSIVEAISKWSNMARTQCSPFEMKAKNNIIVINK